MERQSRNGAAPRDARSISRADLVNANGDGCVSGGRVSLVIPTRNEAGNVVELLRRVAHLPAALVAEVVFVDDSDDDTPQLILDHAESCAFPIRVLHREPGERTGGLSSAVLAGWGAAIGEWLCVMDADLQHPPELITELRDTAIRDRRDLVCATRYGSGAKEHGLGIIRRQLSKTSTLAARLLFPRRLRHMSDPMSGFFVVRRASVDLDRLNPTGFKILLEVLLRFPRLRRTEIPFEFSSRFTGQSKTSLREGLRYLRHLGRLRLGLTRVGAVRSKAGVEPATGCSRLPRMNPARILVVDDHPVFAEALAALLDTYDDIEVVGTVGQVDDAITLASELEPDVAVVDVILESTNGLRLTARLTQELRTRVVVVSCRDDPEMVAGAIRAGASAFVSKDSHAQDFIEALRGAQQGQTWVSARLLTGVFRELTGGAPPLRPEEQLLGTSRAASAMFSGTS